MQDPFATGHPVVPSQARPGRAGEPTETVRRALADALDGRAGALLVRGEAGIGRTTLLAGAAQLAAGHGFRAARARCHPQAHQEPLAAVRQLLEELDCIPQTATGFSRAVTAAQAGRPLLLLVDDLQWCDSWSLRALSHLLHRMAGLRVVLLASIRGDLPVSHPEPCRDVVTGLRQLRLRGLDRAGAEGLARAVLPGEPDPRFVTACLERTGGNPRLLLALLTELAEQRVAPGLPAAGLLARYAPESAAQHVLAMAGGPESDAWQLACAVAVLGGRATLERAARVAGLGLESAAHAADRLFRAELLGSGRPLAFTHPVFADAVARHQPAGTAARMHDRAAAPAPAPAVPAPAAAAVPAVRAATPSRTAARTPATVELRCLGGFRMTIAGVPVDYAAARPKARRLLRLLAMHGGTAVHRELLLEALWPKLPRESGIRNLQVTVSRLRELLGPGLLVRTGDAYGLALDRQVLSDVKEFERAADLARPLPGRPPGAGRATDELRSARGWYAGDLLPEEGPAEWVVEERARLRARAAEVCAALAAAELATGRTGAAVEAAEHSLRLEPFHDGAWRSLITAYHRAGDPASSERASRRYDSLLSSLA